MRAGVWAGGGGGACLLQWHERARPALDPPPPSPAALAHTGSNLAERLLRENLEPGFEVHGGLTAHKHSMQPPPNATAACGTLVLLTVRNPWDWARALYGVCYCCRVRHGPCEGE